jgi:hypothetical protein
MEAGSPQCAPRRPQLVYTLSQKNLAHNLVLYVRSILILSSHPCLGLLRSLFPSGLQTKTLYAFFVSTTVYMPHTLLGSS